MNFEDLDPVTKIVCHAEAAWSAEQFDQARLLFEKCLGLIEAGHQTLIASIASTYLGIAKCSLISHEMKPNATTDLFLRVADQLLSRDDDIYQRAQLRYWQGHTLHLKSMIPAAIESLRESTRLYDRLIAINASYHFIYTAAHAWVELARCESDDQEEQDTATTWGRAAALFRLAEAAAEGSTTDPQKARRTSQRLRMDALINRARALRSRNELAAAVDAWTNLESEFRGQLQSNLRGLVLISLADALFHTGDTQASESRINEALAIDGLDPPLEIQAKLRRAEILMKKGRNNHALEFLDSIDLAPLGPGSVDHDLQLATITRNKAEAFLNLGELQRAEHGNKQASHLYLRHGSEHEHAHCMFNLGQIYTRQGKLVDGNRHYQLAEGLYMKAGDSISLARSLFGRGEVSLRLREYPLAISLLERAQSLYESTNAALGAAQCILVSSQAKEKQARADEALHGYQEAHARFTALGNPFGMANSLCGWAECIQVSEPLLALEKLTTAESIYTSIDSRANLASCLASQAEILFTQDRDEEAMTLLDKGEASARRTGDPSFAPYKHQLLGNTHFRRKNYDSAIPPLEIHMKQVIELARLAGSLDTSREIMAPAGGNMRRLFESLWRTGRFRQSIGLLSDYHCETLSQIRRSCTWASENNHDKRGPRRDTAHLLLHHSHSNEDVGASISFSSGARTYEWLLRLGINKRDLASHIIDLLRLQVQADPSSSKWKNALMGISKLVFHTEGRAVELGSNDNEESRRTLADLLRLAKSSGCTRLQLSPMNSFCLLPFAALSGIDKSQYLFQEFEIFIGVALGGGAPELPPTKQGPARVLVVSDPSRHLPGAATLHGATIECNQVQDILAGAGFDVERRGYGETDEIEPLHPRQLMEIASGFSHVLLSCHGSAVADSAWDSALLMSGTDMDDASLRVGDLSRIDIQPGSTWTLSACETARNWDFDRPLDDPITAAHVLIARGAAGVLGSLWSIEDSSCSSMIRAVYDRVFNEHEDWPAALREAQYDMAFSKEWKSPFWWGAFVFYLPTMPRITEASPDHGQSQHRSNRD